MIEKITPEGGKGHCDICGAWCEHLNHFAMIEIDGWVCPDCGRKIMERVRHRYLIAGEHTEPAE